MEVLETFVCLMGWTVVQSLPIRLAQVNLNSMGARYANVPVGWYSG